MKTQKGITLIALIITIIVMLILVGVSVSTAINTGLFKTASGVSQNTQAEKDNEIKISEGIVNIDGVEVNIDKYSATFGVTLPKELDVGDIIEYVPTQGQTYDASAYTGCSGMFETDMNEGNTEWKIIGKNGNKIEIIPNKVSETELTLEGANGWNNSIDAINSVCRAIYGNTTSDKYIATAKSLTIADINKITHYEAESGTTSYKANEYDETWNFFPTRYLKEKGVNNPIEVTEGSGYAQNSDENLILEQTDYMYMAEEQPKFDTKFSDWVNIEEKYWLADTCVDPYFFWSDSDSYGEESMWDYLIARFFIRIVNEKGKITRLVSYHSDCTGSNQSCAVRPVVSLTPIVEPTLYKTEDGIDYWKFE